MTDPVLAELVAAAEADPSDDAALHALADRLKDAEAGEAVALLRRWARGATAFRLIERLLAAGERGGWPDYREAWDGLVGAFQALGVPVSVYQVQTLARLAAGVVETHNVPPDGPQPYCIIDSIESHATRFTAERMQRMQHMHDSETIQQHNRATLLRQCGQQIVAAIQPDHWYAVRFAITRDAGQEYGNPWRQTDRLRLELLVTPLDGGEVIRPAPPAS